MPFEIVEFPVKRGHSAGVLWGIPVAIERLFMTVYLMEKYSGRDVRSTRGVNIFLAFRLHELRHKHLKKKKEKLTSSVMEFFFLLQLYT